jgi:tripartite-type tricarboxylate transporter receptor subunit TctC
MRTPFGDPTDQLHFVLAHRLAVWLTLIAIATGLIATAQAQSFLSKPVRMIVPFPPGGGGDISSRILAEGMAKGLGQPVIVDNRPGGGAVIGYELGARAPGDGHTLLVVFPSFVINPAVRRGVSYDPLKDFKTVGQTVWAPMAVAVHPSVPAKSLKELISFARARPGEIAYGTPGAGTTLHVVGEMLRLAANINIVHVPYKGAGPAANALVGGHIPMVVSNVAAVASFVKAGRVRPLVVTTSERVAMLPDVPTLRESGYPALVATNWIGVVAPSATPPSVIARLNAELVRTLSNAEVQAKLKAQELFPSPSTPEQFADFLQSEAAKYARVVKEAGIKVD